MTYELCRDATNADHACEVYIKTSADGLNWAPAGTPARSLRRATADLLHTPYVAWVPGGGPNGTLLMSGQRVVTGPTGNKAVMAESGSVRVREHLLGSGSWTELEAPVNVNPTGSYGAWCPGLPGLQLTDHPVGQRYVVPLPGGDLARYRQPVPGAIRHRRRRRTDRRDHRPGRGREVSGRRHQHRGQRECRAAVDLRRRTGQQWTMMADGTIRSFGKCLDIVGNGTANFTKVQLWDCGPAGGQHWRRRPTARC